MRGTLNTYADVKIIDGLKYRISANADLGSDQTESWVPSIANGAMFTAPPQPAVGSYGTSKYVNWLIENMLTYNKTFADKHNVDLLLGYSTQKTTSENAKSMHQIILMMKWVGSMPPQQRSVKVIEVHGQ